MIAGQTILVFAPHPDDEVIACGGTILKRVDAGCRVHICFATDGSQSHRAVLNLDDPPPDKLIEIRKREALNAAAILGVPAENITFVGAPDTRLIDAVDQLRY
jgi:LmbE family N-acetylglucosaminyl deacetylase